MVRVSDEEVAMVINDMRWDETGEDWDMEEQMALDLRDARALLREVQAFIRGDGEYDGAQPEDVRAMYDRIRQHLEGHDEQSQ